MPTAVPIVSTFCELILCTNSLVYILKGKNSLHMNFNYKANFQQCLTFATFSMPKQTFSTVIQLEK